MAETVFLTFRSREVAGSVVDGAAFKFDPAQAGARAPYDFRDLARDVADKRVLFVVHGFNVPARSGAFSASAMEDDFRSDPKTPYSFSGIDLVVGVLWPGDWYVKIVNYSWEYADADRTGDKLRYVIEQHFQRAASISLASHSLGARVVLKAAAGLNRRVRELCVTAAAADDNCLTKQFPRAVANSDRVTVLRSMRDWTLALAYPAGDFLSDVLGDNDSPFEGALGRYGPKRPVPSNVETTLIPSDPHDALGKKSEPLSDFDHTDYFPASTWPRPAKPRKSDSVSRFISAAFDGQRSYWR